MTVANLQALTGEQVSFEFFGLSEKILSTDPSAIDSRGMPHYLGFWQNSVYITQKTTVSVTIPEHRRTPRRFIINVNGEEIVIDFGECCCDCRGRFSKKEIKDGFVAVSVSQGRPRSPSSSKQSVKLTSDYGDYKETLICPISGTDKFDMCLYWAFHAQGGKLSISGT